MFFTKFNSITKEEVLQKVNASPKANTELKPCTLLFDRKFSFKGTGEFAPEDLSYEFSGSFSLDFTENGTSHKNVPYNALQIRENIVLFTHIVPGTSRGWHIVLDLETKLATAFETWFGITVPVGGDLSGKRPPTHHRDINREVQRHYHFGYMDEGQEEPEIFHTTTNRLEGRGLYWENNSGNKWLTFFPSVVCSTSVSLDDPLDTIVITYPSDYIRINEKLYIFAKWGVEFGGEMHLYVLDMFDMKGIGMKFGFNANDEFEYKMNSANLKLTGDAAHLEMINKNGDADPPMAMLRNRGKGARYAYRPRDNDVPMTRAEVDEAVKKRRIFDFSDNNVMTSANCMPFNYDLLGKQIDLNYDLVQTPFAWSKANIPEKLITNYQYDFSEKESLKWREAGGTWHEERYVCFNPARDIYFFSHMLTGDKDYASVTHAVDKSTGLSTCVYARIGNWRSEWEAGATCLFGTAAGEGFAKPPFSKRHAFTSDLTGRSYAWNYSDNSSSIHVYGSPHSYSWTIFQNDNSGGATWSSPGFFIKLREDAYLLQWVEETCNGGQGLVFFNPHILQDSGFWYGVNRHSGLGLSITGAFGRRLGSFEIKGFYE